MINIGIVTADSPETDNSLKVLRRMAEEEDCKITVVDPRKPIDNQKISNIDIIVPRITGHTERSVERQINFFLKIIAQFGLKYVGNLDLLPVQKDKYTQNIMAKKAGLSVPRTILISADDNFESLQKELGCPFIVKACFSFGGEHVFLVDNVSKYENVIRQKNRYLAQKFIKLEDIIDYRVYVVGGRIIGGLKRENKIPGEFRANTRQGGVARFFAPDQELSTLALKYANYTKLEILSVDFIARDGKYYFIESNDAFALRLRTNKIILGRTILRYCRDKAIDRKES